MPRFLLRNKKIGEVQEGSKLIERQFQISLGRYLKSGIFRRFDEIEFQIDRIERYENPDGYTAQTTKMIGTIEYNHKNGYISFNAIDEEFNINTLAKFKTRKFSDHYIRCELQMYENEKFKKYVEEVFQLDDELLFNLTQENASIVDTRIKRQILKRLMDSL